MACHVPWARRAGCLCENAMLVVYVVLPAIIEYVLVMCKWGAVLDNRVTGLCVGTGARFFGWVVWVFDTKSCIRFIHN